MMKDDADEYYLGNAAAMPRFIWFLLSLYLNF